MIYPEGLVNLFKKHGYWRTNLVVFIVMCASIVMAIVYANAVAVVNAIWCGVSIFSNYMLAWKKKNMNTPREDGQILKTTLSSKNTKWND